MAGGRILQIPPAFWEKFNNFIFFSFCFGWYYDRTLCINGKSRGERPPPYEAIRLPLNPGECCQSRWRSGQPSWQSTDMPLDGQCKGIISTFETLPVKPSGQERVVPSGL